MLEVVRIRRDGFPVSLTCESFYETYEQLAFDYQQRSGWKKSGQCSTEECRGYAQQLCRDYLTEKAEFQVGVSKGELLLFYIFSCRLLIITHPTYSLSEGHGL